MRHVRMVHHGKSLPLDLEPGNDVTGIHSRLDHLQRYVTTQRLHLVSMIDNAHPTFTELAQQSVRTNTGSIRIIVGVRTEGGRWLHAHLPFCNYRRKTPPNINP